MESSQNSLTGNLLENRISAEDLSHNLFLNPNISMHTLKRNFTVILITISLYIVIVLYINYYIKSDYIFI